MGSDIRRFLTDDLAQAVRDAITALTADEVKAKLTELAEN